MCQVCAANGLRIHPTSLFKANNLWMNHCELCPSSDELCPILCREPLCIYRKLWEGKWSRALAALPMFDIHETNNNVSLDMNTESAVHHPGRNDATADQTASWAKELDLGERAAKPHVTVALPHQLLSLLTAQHVWWLRPVRAWQWSEISL